MDGPRPATYLLASNACGRTAQAVSDRITRYLEVNGLTPTAELRVADLIIIDTCGFCQAAEDQSLGLIRHCLQHRHGAASLVVVGCLPGIAPTRLAALDGVAFLMPAEMGRLDAITGAQIPFATVHADGAVLRAPTRAPSEQKRACHVTVGSGCLNTCTFCAVKAVWGKLQSRPLDAIVRELQAGVAMGHELIYLAGQDLGAYGVDLGLSVIDLLAAAFAVAGRFKLILHDFNPQWLILHHDALAELLAAHSDKVAYLDVPLQAGSDAVLKRMKRPYRAAEVLAVMRSLKARVPDLILELDLMMGFPGETEADFAQTVGFLDEAMTLDGLCVWLSGFSQRSNTAAAQMQDKIDPDGIMQRFLTLRGMVAAGPARLGTGLVYFAGYRL